MTISFRHIVSTAEARAGYYLNLKDEHGAMQGRELPPHKTELGVIDQKGREYTGRKYLRTQITHLGQWFLDNGATAGTVVEIRHDPEERLSGRPVVHLDVVDVVAQSGTHSMNGAMGMDSIGLVATQDPPGKDSQEVSFSHYTDYSGPLFMLMAEMGTAGWPEVLGLFELRFGHLIPPGHREHNAKGNPRWQDYVNWCRGYLRKQGLLDSPQRGVWSVTGAGREWLRDHPDDGRQALVLRMKQAVNEKSGRAGSAAPRRRLTTTACAARRVFLDQVRTYLLDYLAGAVQGASVRCPPRYSFVQVHCPEFPQSHFELYLTRDCDEIGFHFEGRREDNLSRLGCVQSHVAALIEQLGHPVVAAPWRGQWAHMAIELPAGKWMSSAPSEYGAIMTRFIQVTHPVLRDAFAAVPPLRRRRPADKATLATATEGSAHQILDRQIDHIRRYLAGRAQRPSDEVLCDWVQLCYTFELHREAVEVFDLIDPSAVDAWPYSRARRLAQVCRMHARR